MKKTICDCFANGHFFWESASQKASPFWTPLHPKNTVWDKERFVGCCARVVCFRTVSTVCVVGWILAKGTTNHESAVETNKEHLFVVSKKVFQRLFLKKKVAGTLTPATQTHTSVWFVFSLIGTTNSVSRNHKSFFSTIFREVVENRMVCLYRNHLAHS